MGTLSLALWMSIGTAQAGPGDHIRAGDLEIVPDVDLGAEYRSNVYRSEGGGPGAANLLLSPGIRFTLDGPSHTVRLGGEWKLRKFLYLGAAEGADPEASRASRLDRFNDARGSLSLDLFKRSALGLRLSEQISFQNNTTDAPLADLPYTSMLHQVVSGAVRVNPASALSVFLGGRWGHDEFYTPVGGTDDPLNVRDAAGPELEARWAFLPRTSVVLRGKYLFNRWRYNALDSDSGDGGISIADSEQLKVIGGLDGQLTEKLFLTLMGGYGIAPYDGESPGTISNEDPSATSVTGSRRILVNTQVRYDIRQATADRPGTKVVLGYVRDFRDSFFTNWVGMDQVSLRFDGRVGRFLPSASAQVRWEDYHGEITREDVMRRLQGDLAYRLQDYASVSVGTWWHRRRSSDPTADYDDVNVHVTATFQY